MFRRWKLADAHSPRGSAGWPKCWTRRCIRARCSSSTCAASSGLLPRNSATISSGERGGPSSTAGSSSPMRRSSSPMRRPALSHESIAEWLASVAERAATVAARLSSFSRCARRRPLETSVGTETRESTFQSRGWLKLEAPCQVWIGGGEKCGPKRGGVRGVQRRRAAGKVGGSSAVARWGSGPGVPRTSLPCS